MITINYLKDEQIQQVDTLDVRAAAQLITSIFMYSNYELVSWYADSDAQFDAVTDYITGKVRPV